MMASYKELYEWEKASLQETEEELRSVKKVHAKLFEAHLQLTRDFKSRGKEVIKLRNELVETTEHYEEMLGALELRDIEKYVMLKEQELIIFKGIYAKTIENRGRENK